VLDRSHCLAAVRYVERNPVRAGLVRRAEAYPYSSAAAHVRNEDDLLVKVAPMLAMAPNWREYLSDPTDDELLDAFRRHQRTGRPLGDARFLRRLERQTGRRLLPARPGRKPKEK
jgi:putative transposase